MKRTMFAATVMLAALGLPSAGLAQRGPAVPNTGGLPGTCPTLEDLTSALKLAEAKEVVLRLRKDAEQTQDAQCAGYTKIIEDGLQKTLLAVVSQQQSKVCHAYSQPEVRSALAATFLVGYMYNSTPCQAFK